MAASRPPRGTLRAGWTGRAFGSTGAGRTGRPDDSGTQRAPGMYGRHGTHGGHGTQGTQGRSRTRVGSGDGDDRTGGRSRTHGTVGTLTHALGRTGRALRRPVTGAGRGIRKVTHAHGAGESGLGKLIELHAVNGAGDVMITVSLASTVFFAVPTDEARGRVALYLAITMAPFAVLAPVIGPLLDHVPHGRRAAMACSMLARALLAVVLMGAVASGAIQLYPAALGVLVASKAYGVIRSAVVPRLLPSGFSLVKANSRVTLGGLLATGVAAPVAAGLQLVGPRWPLVGAMVIFVAGTYLSLALPAKVDSAKGEQGALLAADPDHLHGPHRRETWGGEAWGGDTWAGERWTGDVRAADTRTGTGAESGAQSGAGTGAKSGAGTRARRARSADRREGARRPVLRTVGSAVTHALTVNCTQRCLSGFLTFFLAFLLREHPLSGQSAAVSLGIVGVAAGAGNALGTAVGAWLRARAPELIIVTVVALVVAAGVVAATFFDSVLVALLAAVAGFAQALSKLSLDALIQRDVPEAVRNSAFARSETILQMSWVVGGAIGIVLPLNGPLGLAVGSVIVGAGWATTLRGLLSSVRHAPTGHHRVL